MYAQCFRFITISADLPTYPEHHLDASAGVLEAPVKQVSAAIDYSSPALVSTPMFA